MAPIIPTPPLTPSKIPKQNHDVFLSFRGEDTRYSFTSHLYTALKRLQVKTYIDNELHRGDEISPSLLKAINDAKLSVIIFSENYASSTWCLEELVKILKCKKNNGQVFVPIFYHVNPTNVRNQTGSYAIAFAEHEKRRDKNKIQTWRLALAVAANFSGWDSFGIRNESELVEQIALDILEKLDIIKTGGLERRINTYKQIVEQKQEKSLETGNLVDLEEHVNALYQLAELKLEKEKANYSYDSSVWVDVSDTYERIMQLKGRQIMLIQQQQLDRMKRLRRWRILRAKFEFIFLLSEVKDLRENRLQLAIMKRMLVYRQNKNHKTNHLETMGSEKHYLKKYESNAKEEGICIATDEYYFKSKQQKQHLQVMKQMKPFATTKDDPELNLLLKEKVRWGDPMSAFVVHQDVQKKRGLQLLLIDMGLNRDDTGMK